jgi:hypothetical protein
MNWLRTWLLSRQLDARLRQRRVARTFRSEAAKRGQSTEWKRRAAKCREVMG